MFTKGQKVWCNIRGWGVVENVSSAMQVYIQFDGMRGQVACYSNGKYSQNQNQCVFPGKPIISGYEPPPFEGKLKKGELYIVYGKSEKTCEDGWIVSISNETEELVSTVQAGSFLKSYYNFKYIGERVY